MITYRYAGVAAVALMILASECMAAEEPVTWIFRDGHRGYGGTRDIGITDEDPGQSDGSGRNIMIGRSDEEKDFVGLVKFTGLQIPEGSAIQSATLSVYHRRWGGGSLNLSVHGLLQDFSETASGAAPGGANWEMTGIRQNAWSAPGASEASGAFTYDGSADQYDPSDDQAHSKGSRHIRFDVTPSFTSQFESGREFGWLLKATNPLQKGYIRIYTREMENPDVALPVRPELKVTFIPPPGTAVLRNESGPRLLNFQIGDPRDVIKHMDEVARMPFDGAVFDPQDDRRLGSGEGWMHICTFGPDKLKIESFSRFAAAMKTLRQPPSPLQFNFIRINALPGTLEKLDEPYNWDNRPRHNDLVSMWWSEAFDAVLHNVRIAARLAKETGMKGILFDWEQYGGDMFNFSKQKDAQALGKSLEETRGQVRHRAEQIMQVFNEEYPNMTLIIIIDGYYAEAPDLLNSFLDGWFAAADPRMVLVDGNERGYYVQTLDEFREIYDHDYSVAPTISAVPEKYLRHMEVGFGVWLEEKGWSLEPEIYSRSAARWQVVLENAMAVADTYVWVFTGEGGNYQAEWLPVRNIPPSYIEATRRARELARLRKGFTP